MTDSIINKQFNEWTVLEELGDGKILCRCSCGTVRECNKYTVTHGKSKSCGCLSKIKRKSQAKENSLLHKQINSWTVIEDNGQEMIRCQCVCGTIKLCNRYHVINGRSKSCGCNRTPFKDTENKKFNEWTILQELGNGKVMAQCSCGTVKECYKYHITSGLSKSCGCKSLETKSQLKQNLEGQTINEWTIVKELGKGKVIARCSCGLTKECVKTMITTGRSKSCGHSTNKRTHLVGKTINEWTIIDELGYGWVTCRCSCGTIKTMKKAYVVQGYTQSCGCKRIDKMKDTVMRLYGETTTNRKDNPREKWQIDAIQTKDNFTKFLTTRFSYKPTIKELVDVLGINEASVGRVIKKYDTYDYVDISPIASAPEKQLRDYVASIYDKEVQHNVRGLIGRRELDIYLPDQKLAIEFNGDYWHSDINVGHMYHQEKTVDCARQGIRLIHVFQYEWNTEEQQNKIKKYIGRLLNTQKLNSVYARNTEVCQITHTEAVEFESKYHLQGSANSSINIGLKLDNKIIGVMTFGVPRFSSEAQYELIRLCFSDEYRVVGGSEKMFKYFVSQYSVSSVVTYCDISKFSGDVYLRLGFKADSNMLTKPNYKWVNPYKSDVLSRYQTQKQKLVNKGLGAIDQTEDEIMENLGYFKIYDAGNLKFIWKQKE